MKLKKNTENTQFTCLLCSDCLQHGDQCREYQANDKKHTSGINTEINVNGQKLETVTRFTYLGSVTTEEGSKPEDTLQDSTDNSSTDKVEISLE